MGKNYKKRKIAGSESGSVMMEYLILNMGFFVVLALAAHFMMPDFKHKNVYGYDPVTGAITQKGTTADHDSEYGEYGRLGAAFIRHYNMVLDIISMPYP